MQPKRSRLWLNDGSCIRLRPLYPNHVWSFDFVEARTNDGRRLRLMTLIDEFSRRRLAIYVARRINAIDVIETLAAVMLSADNGPEMVAKVLRQWLTRLGSESLYIERILRIVQWQAETSCSMGRSSTALRKPRRSSRNPSTTTPGDPIRRSVTDLRHHSPSRRNHQPSTGLRACNNLSLRLVQNIGRVSDACCFVEQSRFKRGPLTCNINDYWTSSACGQFAGLEIR